MEQIDATPFPNRVLSVTELTRMVKTLIEKDSVLSGTWVQGEVSNLVKASSGHCYFTLKDEKAVIKAAIWAGVRRRVKIEFKNGDHLQIFGSLSVYEPRGEYQIIVSDVRPAGVGALYEAYEKLKKQLQAEGLFDPERKLALPFLPKGVGIVTSPKGAVVQDIFRVVRRRFPNMPLYLVGTKVQGAGAAEEIAAGIKVLEQDPRVDVIIIARGGGSIEDLWSFNEEAVARAVASAKKPIVSAVGHETDTTIADLVADRRAATPSVAGELVVPVKIDLLRNIGEVTNRLGRAMKNKLVLARNRLAKSDACRFLKRPELLIAERRLKAANLSRDLEAGFRQFVSSARHRFEMLGSRLLSSNPRGLLQRGYLMATDEQGNLVASVDKVKTGMRLRIDFHDGSATGVIESVP